MGGHILTLFQYWITQKVITIQASQQTLTLLIWNPSKGYEKLPHSNCVTLNIVSLGIDALVFFIILRLGLVYSLKFTCFNLIS